MPSKRPTIKDLERQLANANDALEAALALSPERDNNFFTGGLSLFYDSRNTWDRKKIFSEALRAYRVNPIARRIVKLTTSFVIGKGIKIKSTNTQAQKYLDEWWKHPLNKLDRNVKRWMDELTRTGNLFPLFTVTESGMTFIRMVPAEQIEEIVTAENDVEQETRYKLDPTDDGWPAYQPDGEQKIFMMHFAVNQPIGSEWGEGDLVPSLVWIGRYASWLEDRVRLNRFRTAFMYRVRGSYKSEAERSAREKNINANPPKHGSVLVENTNAGEEWDILTPKLDSSDANTDGLAIKKMIASGNGFPLHYLAEPESATRTTAEAAGTPTFRALEDIQDDFFEILSEMARVACEVKGIDPGEISIAGPDITERDNATLALGFARAFPALAELYDREGIEPDEFMRLLYKMLAEVWEDKKAPNIRRKPLIQPTQTAPEKTPEDDKTDKQDPKEEPNLAALFQSIAQRDPQVIVNVPVQPPAHIDVHLPEQPKPEISVTLDESKRKPVIVHVAAPEVTVNNQVKLPEMTESVVVERDDQGRATRIEKTIKQTE